MGNPNLREEGSFENRASKLSNFLLLCRSTRTESVSRFYHIFTKDHHRDSNHAEHLSCIYRPYGGTNKALNAVCRGENPSNAEPVTREKLDLANRGGSRRNRAEIQIASRDFTTL